MRVSFLKKKYGELTWPVIITIILSSVFLIFGFIILGKLNNGSLIDVTKCETSVKAMSAVARLNFDNVGELNCATNYQTITEQSVEKQKKIIADSMASCWQEFNKGVKLFDVKDNIYCVVCAKLDFTNPTLLDHFGQYLANENYGSQTYLGYLTNTDPLDAQPSYIDGIPDDLDTHNSLAVVFTQTKVLAHNREAFEAGGGVVSGGAMALYGFGIVASLPVALVVGTVGIGITAIGYLIPSVETVNQYSSVIVAPYDQLKNTQCTILEGKQSLKFV